MFRPLGLPPRWFAGGAVAREDSFAAFAPRPDEIIVIASGYCAPSAPNGGGGARETTHMRKIVAGAALALIVSAGGGTAFAGEITGGPNPKPTPIDEYNAGSICSFSGQNDVPAGDIDPETGELDPLSVGRVQSWGQTLNLAAATFLPEGTKGKSALTEDIHAFGPGASCRGYASGGG
jgi:hypothetical protein